MQPWNPTASNQENDAQYAADSQRAGGATDPSIFLSPLANKLFYQLSTYLTALFTAFAAKGFTTSDSNLSTLTAQCANFFTTADVRSPITIVPSSPTLTLDASNTNGFYTQLTSNTTITAVNGVVDGQIITFCYFQDSVGGRTIAFPSTMFEAVQPDQRPNSFSVQMFIVGPAGGGGQFLRPVGPLMSEVGLFTNEGHFASSVVVAGSLNVGAFQIGGGAPSGQVLTGNGSSYVPVPPPPAAGSVMNVVNKQFAVEYQNPGPNTLFVSVSGFSTGGPGNNYTLSGNVGGSSGSEGLVVQNTHVNGGGANSIFFMVPPGAFYTVTVSSVVGPFPTVQVWTEWS